MKHLGIIIFLFTQLSCYSQQWIRYYGQNQQAFPAYCIESYDKGYVLTGNINNYHYAWILKTDINGNPLWNLKLGDATHETMSGHIEQTLEHGYILCGSTTIYNSPHSDPFIVKLNSCGDLEWCKVIILDGWGDGALSVKPTPDGGYVLFTLFYGNLPDDLLHLFKFNSSGDILWQKIYNGDTLVESEMPTRLYADSTNFLMAGACYYPNWMKPYFIQTDTSGNETWSLAYSQHTGLGVVGDAWATLRDKYGNYYSAGRAGAAPELFKFSAGGYEMMNADLTFDNMYDGASRTIVMYDDTTLIMDAGWITNNDINYWSLNKIDTLGNIKKTKLLPNPSTSGGNWCFKTFDNKIYNDYPLI